MPKQHPFDEIFRQISELLVNIHKKPVPPISSEISNVLNDQLSAVEQRLDLLQKVNEDSARQSGIDTEKTEQLLEDPKGAPREERKILESARRLRGDLTTLESAFTDKIKEVSSDVKQQKFAGAKRKKKFKRLGGEGWMPL